VVSGLQAITQVEPEWRQPNDAARTLEQRGPDAAFLRADRLAHAGL